MKVRKGKNQVREGAARPYYAAGGGGKQSKVRCFRANERDVV